MAEKLSIEPIYDTNWCDMPAEIKLECVGKMEFNERLSLRCTAKTERALVDSQKIEFSKGEFVGDDQELIFLLYRENGHFFSRDPKDLNKALEFLKYIMKVGVFENLEIGMGNLLTDNEQFMTDDKFFTAKNIKFEYCDFDNMIAILRKVKNGVESIKIDRGIEISRRLSEILAIPLVQNAKYWHIQDYEKTDSIYKVAQMWIDKDSKIGSTFQVSVFGDESFKKFLKRFTDRIVSKNEKRVRIRTNNSDRHILLERGLDDTVGIDYLVKFYRLIVISSEMKESVYNDNCKEWICKIDPDVYEENDSELSFELSDDLSGTYSYDDDNEEPDNYEYDSDDIDSEPFDY
ncbi:unnamed protein product [Caenorhabditis nigoni]